MGGNLSCAKGVDETTEEFTALRKVYEWFETEEKNSDGVYVKIPLKRFQGCARYIKGTLDRGIDTSYLLHVTRKDTLPKLPSRGELQSNKDFTEIGNVIDMGFLDGDIYSCEMNDSAFKEITHFCSRHVSVDDISPVTSDGTHASTEENLNSMHDLNDTEDIQRKIQG